MTLEEQMVRWRLILGSETEKSFSEMYDGISLTEEQMLMDNALASIYGTDKESFANKGNRGAG